MTWLQPWAWLGVGAVALPIVIHLLGHGPARVVRFPSLRFIDGSRLLPTRRTRIHDPPLLAVRCAILCAAAAAMAQPVLARHLRATGGGRVARVIVVDTSASMERPMASGGVASHEARRIARALADSTPLNVVIQSDNVSEMIAPAGDWLRQQPGRGEVVVITDAQRGSLDAADVAALPADLGFRVIALGAIGAAAPMQWRTRTGNGTTLISATGASVRDFSWQWTAGDSITARVTLFTAPAQAGDAGAARTAALSLGTFLPGDSSTSVHVIYPGAPDEPALLRNGRPVGTGALVKLAAAIAGDSLLLGTAWNAASAQEDSTPPPSWSPLVTGRSGSPLLFAAESSASGRPVLQLLLRAPPQSLLSAAALAAIDRALSRAPQPAERNPETIDSATLARWQRPAPARSALPADASRSRDTDARWLWALALVLLVIETGLRRRVMEARVA